MARMGAFSGFPAFPGFLAFLFYAVSYRFRLHRLWTKETQLQEIFLKQIFKTLKLTFSNRQKDDAFIFTWMVHFVITTSQATGHDDGYKLNIHIIILLINKSCKINNSKILFISC